MTQKEFIKIHGEKPIKEITGIFHIYVRGETMEKHNELDRYISANGNRKVKDVIKEMDDLLEFEG